MWVAEGVTGSAEKDLEPKREAEGGKALTILLRALRAVSAVGVGDISKVHNFLKKVLVAGILLNIGIA